MDRIYRWGMGLLAGLAILSAPARGSRISELETGLEALKARMAEVEEREENYRKAVESSKRANHDLLLEVKKGQADLKTEIQGLKQDLSQLEQAVQDLGQRMAEMEARLNLTPQQGGTPVLTTAQADKAERAAASEAMPPLAQARPQAGAISPGETKLSTEGYDLGVRYYNEGKFDAARAAFEAFIKAGPGSPASEDAQFKIAECYFRQNDFKRATLEYDKFTKDYPAGKKMPMAMFRMGLCFEKLDKKDIAEATYKGLIAAYPNSPEAAQAKTQIGKMKKK